MPISLSREHRKLLEKTTTTARILAESACRAALENLAVGEKTFWPHMTEDQKKLRNRLRARGRALGDQRDKSSNTQEIRHLTEAAAYEHWHRLLFTRFLTENNLLITDEANGHVPVRLEDCEELAPELGARDGLDLACRFASRTLPGVFRHGDPVLDLPIAIDDQVEMRKLLAALPPEIFRSDDALGWTYQFWQTQRKNEVNKSGKKIGADEIAPVTQLFTEDYMVEFLLHNTLGAWWAGKLGPIQANTEEEARARAALPGRDGVPAITWTYLRFVQDEKTKTWRPAAGTFDGWPKLARLIRLLDPCMGSGHFLVFALPILVRLRMEEENLTPQAAVAGVLKDNIHGLEIDERCTQIAAFNVALTAWRLAGYQTLPPLNLACSGLAPSATEEEWVALAGDNDRLQRGMSRLYNLFKDAPVLGSLINPRAQGGNLIEAEFQELADHLTTALASESLTLHPSSFILHNSSLELAVTAQGLAKAAEILAGLFTLVATNVPYLGQKKQGDVLKNYCQRVHTQAKADLATCCLERSLAFCTPNGNTALVAPQNWLFLGSYSDLREKLLRLKLFHVAAWLGSGAFETISGEVVNVVLFVIENSPPRSEQQTSCLDVSGHSETRDKVDALAQILPVQVNQNSYLAIPDFRITSESIDSSHLLGQDAISPRGVVNGDQDFWLRFCWELPGIDNARWRWLQSAVLTTVTFGGRERIIDWSTGGAGMLRPGHANPAYGRVGVAVSRMSQLPACLYTGELYDQNSAVLVPTRPANLEALWAFCTSKKFAPLVRKLDKKIGVTPATLLKVPFDLAHWQKVAAEKYPNGLPKPHSDDPMQWLFNGHPKGSDQPLHVAVARLLGYRWPRQTGSSFPDCPALGPDGLEEFADKDGIVCLPPLSREQPGAARLRQLLFAALGSFDERALIAAAGPKGSKSRTLEDWLRDEFFAQHAKLFHDRPFIWHIWDGRSDGFHALVNYHKLDHAMLQKLTYSYLGNWIQQQDEDARADKPGAADRLGAARKLQIKLAAILEGEAKLDIFVRWKPIKDQAQGWHPDLNDGVRQNIRPFLLAGDVGKKGAGLFRAIPIKLKDKDRGTEPHRPKEEYPWFWCEDPPGVDPKGGEEFIGARWNNVHLSLEKKGQTHRE